MQVTINVKDWFLDRAAVAERVGKLRQRALMVAGSYIRRAARDLLRPAKKSADPGQPPRIHSREPNLKTIFFFLDPQTNSMVAGPLKFGNTTPPRNSNRDTTPELQEYGGTAEVTEYALDGEADWLPYSQAKKAAKKAGKTLRSRKRQAVYAEHPFMRAALAAAMPTIPQKFRDLL